MLLLGIELCLHLRARHRNNLLQRVLKGSVLIARLAVGTGWRSRHFFGSRGFLLGTHGTSMVQNMQDMQRQGTLRRLMTLDAKYPNIIGDA